MSGIVPLAAFADNYIWTLHGDNVQASDRPVVVVDPGEAGPVIQYLQRTSSRLAGILVTHHHPDHTGGIDELLRIAEAPVYGPAEDSRPIPGLSHPLGDGDRVSLDVLDLDLEVLAVPGHTAGHIAYYGGEILLSGDTLFYAGCGRLFEGDAAQMRASLSRLRALPDATNVYCGHEYTEKNLSFAAAVEPANEAIAAETAKVRAMRADNNPTPPSTIGLEKRINPFFRWDVPDVIEAAQTRAGRRLSEPDAVFAALREWKNAF